MHSSCEISVSTDWATILIISFIEFKLTPNLFLKSMLPLVPHLINDYAF